jgi:hypothetical protein
MLTAAECALITKRSDNEFYVTGAVRIGETLVANISIPRNGIKYAGIDPFEVVSRSCLSGKRTNLPSLALAWDGQTAHHGFLMPRRQQPSMLEFRSQSGEGMLIAFATGPGQTALDGQEGTNSSVCARLDRPRHAARRRDSAGDDPGPRPGQQGSTALGPHQSDRLGLSEPGCSACLRRCRTGVIGPCLKFRRYGRRTRVLALGQGIHQAGRAQRSSKRLSQWPVQVAGAGPDCVDRE